MTISVVLAHPDSGSFNHAIAFTCVAVLQANGHKVNFHDLYAERFDCVLPFGEFPKDVTLPPDIKKPRRPPKLLHLWPPQNPPPELS